MVGARIVAGVAAGAAFATIVAACSSSYGASDETAPDAATDTGGDAASLPESGTTDAGTDAPLPRGSHVFSKSFGGVDEDYLTRANVDLSGNLLLAGSFASTLDFGIAEGVLKSSGALDAYFAKLDRAGQTVFAKSYGDALGQNGVNIVGTGSGDIYASAVFSGTVTVSGMNLTSTDAEFDSLILRYGADGTVKESFLLPGTARQFISGLAYDGSHGVYFSGFNTGVIPGSADVTSNGGNDVLVGHAVSTQNWTDDFGDPSEQLGTDVAYDPAGSVVVVGYHGGTLDFGDGRPHTSAGGYDAFVARVSAAGTTIWSRSFGGAGDQTAALVAIGSGGEIVVLGTFTGSMAIGNDLASAGAGDIFLAKLASDGTPLWSKRFGGAADDAVGGLALAANGDIVIGGRTNGDLDLGLGPLAPAGDADAFVARLDKDGKAIWAKRFGDSAFQTVSGVGLTLANEVWIAGYYTGTIDLGGGPFTSQGKHDVFIARFSP